MREVYVFSPVEFAAAMMTYLPRCQCHVCVGVRGWAACVSVGAYDPGDRTVRDTTCLRMPRILERKALKAARKARIAKARE